MTHLTDFSRLLSRRASRRGLVDHKRSITTSSGREKPACRVEDALSARWCVEDALSARWCVEDALSARWWAKSVHLVRCGACPMPRIARRTAPARLNGFGSIKWVIISDRCTHRHRLRLNEISPPCRRSTQNIEERKFHRGKNRCDSSEFAMRSHERGTYKTVE